MKKMFAIEIDCAHCAQKVEMAINKLDGVIACNVNFLTQKMTLEANDESFDEILKAAIKAGKKIEPDFEIIK